MPKVRTNMTPSELRKVAKGLKGLARSRELASISSEDCVEYDILVKLDKVLDIYQKGLRDEFDRILLGED